MYLFCSYVNSLTGAICCMTRPVDFHDGGRRQSCFADRLSGNAPARIVKKPQ
jgi:hypothetical protein